MHLNLVKPFLLALLLVVALGPVGCASSPRDAKHRGAIRTMDATTQLSEEVTASKLQVQRTITALETLPNAGSELKKNFAQLDKQIKAMNESADDVAAARAEMKNDFARYQEHWYGDAVTFDNPTLREAAQQRLNEVREDFNAIDPAYVEVRRAYDPFLQHLGEVRTYLANDLTTPAVQAMVPTFEQSRQNAADLRTAMDQLLIKLRQFSESLAPETSAQVDGPAS